MLRNVTSILRIHVVDRLEWSEALRENVQPPHTIPVLEPSSVNERYVVSSPVDVFSNSGGESP